MKVFLTGGGGTLGRELRAALSPFAVVAPARRELDVRDRAAVLAAVTATQPDVIVHSAAMTDVDGCEERPDDAYAANALATRYAAEAAARVGAHLCYVSTDYVFDGARDAAYAEWDAPNPISVYGRSKLAGEQEAGPDAAVVRTSWVCGTGERNFVASVLRLAGTHEVLRFIDDQRSRPTMARDLAPVIRALAVDRRRGLFHVTNDGTASRFEMVQVILEAAGHDPARVQPIPAHELDPPQRAARPRQSVLDNAVRRLEGAAPLPDWHESLPEVVRELLDRRAPVRGRSRPGP